MARIFISYSRADRVFLDGFVPLIRKVYGNDSLWFDGDIHGGADWWQMILDEVGKCALFIYLVSNESLESPYCQAELREALRLNKHILPVTVRRLKPAYPGDIDADLAEVLRRTQYIDFSGGFNDSATAASLYGAINRLLERVPQQQPAPQSSEPVTQPPVPDRKSPTVYSWPRIGILAATVTIIVIAALVFILMQEDDAPDDTPQSTPGPTLLPVEQLAMTRVTRNDDWSPVERQFGGVTMVLVPAGCFNMGTEDGGPDESPVSSVCIDAPFWIDKYEVTNAQYDSYGCEDYSSRPDQPRNCVTWFEARDFCEARDARLPGEAEWEYAARGPDGLVYPWGNNMDAGNVVYWVNADGHTADVGSRPDGASWVGALDMSGNLEEWTYSLYEAYPYDAADGRERDTGTSTNVERVVRSSAYYITEPYLYAASRAPHPPDDSLNFIGFRCARDIG